MNDENEPSSSEDESLTEEKIKQLIEQLGITEDTLEELYQTKKIDDVTYNNIKEYLDKKKKKRNLWLAISAAALVIIIILIFLFKGSTIDFRINTLNGGNPVQANITFNYTGGMTSGVTDANGQLIVKTPSSGTYDIIAEYNGTTKEITGSLSEKSVDVDFSSGQEYVPEPGSVPNQVETISSTDSSPIESVTITYKINGGRVLSNTTDANGEITIYAKPGETVELIKIQADGYKLVNEISFVAKDLENGQPHLEQIIMEPESSLIQNNTGQNQSIQTKINIKVEALDSSTNNPIPNAQISVTSQFGENLGSTITGTTGQGIIRDIIVPQSVTISGAKTGFTAQDVSQDLDSSFQDTINVYFTNASASLGLSGIPLKTTFVQVKTIDDQLVAQQVNWTLYFKKNGCVGIFPEDNTTLLSSGLTNNGMINLDAIINASSVDNNNCYKVQVNSDNPIQYFDEESSDFAYGENTTVFLTPINSTTSTTVTVNISRYYGADANNTILNITDIGAGTYFGGYVVQGSPNAMITINNLRIGRIYQFIANKGIENASLQTSFNQPNSNVSLLLDGGNAILNFHVMEVDQSNWNKVLNPDLTGAKLTIKQGNVTILDNVNCDNGDQIARCDTSNATNTIKVGIDVQIIAKKDGFTQTSNIGSRIYPGVMLLTGTNTPDINVTMYNFTGCSLGDGSNGVIDGDPYNTTCGRIFGIDLSDMQGNLVNTLTYGQYYATLNYFYNNSDVIGFRVEVDNQTNYVDQRILLGGFEYNDYTDQVPPQYYRSGLYNLKVQQQKLTSSLSGEQSTVPPITQSNLTTKTFFGTNYDFFDLNNSRAFEIEFKHDPANIQLQGPDGSVNTAFTFLLNVDDPIPPKNQNSIQVPIYVTMWLKKAVNGNNENIIVKRIPLNITLSNQNYLTFTPSGNNKPYINNVSTNDWLNQNIGDNECNDQLLCSSIGTDKLASSPNDPTDTNGVCIPTSEKYFNNFCSLGVYSKPSELYSSNDYREQDVTVIPSITDGIVLCANGQTNSTQDSRICPGSSEVCRVQIDLGLNNQPSIRVDSTNQNNIWDMVDGFPTNMNITVRPKIRPTSVQAGITSGDARIDSNINDTISKTQQYSVTINKGPKAKYFSNYTITCTSGTKTASLNLTFNSIGDDNRCPDGKTFDHATGTCEVLKFTPPEIPADQCQNALVYDTSFGTGSSATVALRNNRSEIILDYNASAGGYQGTCFGVLIKDENNTYTNYSSGNNGNQAPTIKTGNKGSETDTSCNFLSTDGTSWTQFDNAIANWNDKYNGIGSVYDDPSSSCVLYGTTTNFKTWNRTNAKYGYPVSQGQGNTVVASLGYTGLQQWDYGNDPRGKFTSNLSWSQKTNQPGYETDYFTLYQYTLTAGFGDAISLPITIWNFFSKERNDIKEAFNKSVLFAPQWDVQAYNGNGNIGNIGYSSSISTGNQLSTSCDNTKNYCFQVNVTDQLKDIDQGTILSTVQENSATVQITVSGDSQSPYNLTNYGSGIYYITIPICTTCQFDLLINGQKTSISSSTISTQGITKLAQTETLYSQLIDYTVNVKRKITDSTGVFDTINEPAGTIWGDFQSSSLSKWFSTTFTQGVGHIYERINLNGTDKVTSILFKTIIGNSLYTAQTCSYAAGGQCDVSFESTQYPVYAPNLFTDQDTIIPDQPYYQSPLYQIRNLTIDGQRNYKNDPTTGAIIGFTDSYPRVQVNFSYLPSKEKTVLITCDNTDKLQSTIYGIGPNIQNTFKTCPVTSGQDIISIIYCGYDKRNLKVNFRILHVGTLTKELTLTNAQGNSLPFYYVDNTGSSPVKMKWDGNVSLVKGFITNINSIDNTAFSISSSELPTGVNGLIAWIANAGVKTSSGPANSIEEYDKPSLTYFLKALQTASTDKVTSPGVQNFLSDINSEISPKQITNDSLCNCNFVNSVIDCAH
ncbi:Carboxypeptidase regulatory-like domain protein [uncultured archaeon]|nr:Carboxypeptidase regulatory-like domain protein [uncultured archaeon]